MRTRSHVIRRIALVGAVAMSICPVGGGAAEPQQRQALAPLGPARPEIAERIRERRSSFAAASAPVRPVRVATEPRAADLARRIGERMAEFAAVGGAGASGLGAVLPARNPRSSVLDARVTAASGETIEVRRAPGSGTPRQMRGRRLHRATGTGGTRFARDTATARDFLRARRGLLRIKDPDAELRVERTEVDTLGYCQVRFAQSFRGLDVWPSGLVVQVNTAGDVDSLSGVFVPTPRRVVTKPSVTAAAAITAARAAVDGGGSATVPDPELIVHVGKPSLPRLAWKCTVDVSMASSWIVVVDAHTGAVLRSFNRVGSEDVAGSGTDLLGTNRTIHVWHEGNTYYMVDTSKQMFVPFSDPPSAARGAILVGNANHTGPDPFPTVAHVTSVNPNLWSLPDAVSASFGLSQTYDYYLARHSRNSIDGQGGTLYGFVKVGNNYMNANWANGVMFFGDGLPYAASLDVIGHEMTHGVTEATAGLIYQDQSGSLNEAMSDIFGE